nr:serine hydrolase domain-containing protein [Mycobacterium tuberculosis]
MPVLRRLGCSVLALGLLAGCAPPRTGPASSPTNNGAKADAVIRIVRDFMTQAHLKAVLVRVTVAGKEVVTRAVGDSMTGVPATTAMHFRNGAVAISYVATLLLKLVDEKKLRLDDKLSRWLPDFPHADRVTLGQLAQMTSGYPDYVLGNEAFDAELYANPFRQWTTQELLDQISSRPLLYDPGTNWNYAHTNYLLLGLALEKAAGQDMPASGRAPTGEPTGNGEARCWSSPRAPFPTSTPSRPASSPVGARPRRARRLRCATTVGPTRRSPTPAAAKRAISSCWPARPRTSAVRPTRTTEPPRAHGRASRPADRGGPLVGPYGPPGRSQNATHNAQAGIDTHCSCPSAVRSQYIGPGFPQSFAPSGEHG